MWLTPLAQATLNESIGSYHAFTAHFPVLFFAAALIWDLLYYFDKIRSPKGGHWLVIFGVIACMPVLFTGIAAAQHAQVQAPILAKHLSLGYMTAVGTSLYSGLRISDMWWHLEIPASMYIMIDIVMIALISWTADYGWLAQVKGIAV
jgi:uncharacterized membrane protein